MAKIIAVMNEKGGVGYEKLYIMQSWSEPRKQVQLF